MQSTGEAERGLEPNGDEKALLGIEEPRNAMDEHGEAMFGNSWERSGPAMAQIGQAWQSGAVAEKSSDARRRGKEQRGAAEEWQS